MLWFLAHLLNGMANTSDGTLRHLMAQLSSPPPPRCSQEELLGVGRWAHTINFKHGSFAIEKGTNTSPRQKLLLLLREGLEAQGSWNERLWRLRQQLGCSLSVVNSRLKAPELVNANRGQGVCPHSQARLPVSRTRTSSLFSLSPKEFEIFDTFLGMPLKNKVLKIMLVQKQT